VKAEMMVKPEQEVESGDKTARLMGIIVRVVVPFTMAPVEDHKDKKEDITEMLMVL
jgi:hypothetical protein